MLPVTNIVVNAGYLGAQIIAHCAVRRDLPSLQISVEPEPLETGGGVKQALPQLGSEPFCYQCRFALDGRDYARFAAFARCLEYQVVMDLLPHHAAGAGERF